jgi:hypothetical protein
MSDLILKDGTGSGYRVKVTSDNSLQVDATTRSNAQYRSSQGVGFAVALQIQSVTGGTEYAALRFKNTDTTRNWRVNNVFLSYNGGDTNHNRMCEGRFYVGMTAPSANATVVTPGNLNLSSSGVAQADAHVWDGVGSGMTVVSNGVLAYTGLFGPGFNQISFDGATVLGLNDILGLTVKPEETGKIALIMTGWFEEA